MLRRSDETQISALLDRIPGQLYRYASIDGERLEWLRKTLADSALFFASRNRFNDPLDCTVPPVFEGSALTIERFWTKQTKADFPHYDRRQLKRHVTSQVRTTKSISGRAGLSAAVLQGLDEHGILSVSKHPDKMLMWSYYAGGHTGIAIRLNASREHLIQIRESMTPVEVQYHRHWPRVDFFKATTHELIWGILGSKAQEWSHEGEWRFVAAKHTGYIQVPPAMINGVILGLKTRPDDEASIRRWIKQRHSPTELLRIRNKPKSFDLEIGPA